MMVLRSRRRLFGLFLAAVLLPCALLVLLTVRGIRQERELAGKRAADEQARVFVQVRRTLHARLDRISSQALSARRAVPRSMPYGDSVVRLVADVVGGRLVPPWQVAGRSSPLRTSAAAEFAAKLRDGETQEFARGNLVEAARRYVEAIAAGRRAEQVGLARLALARVQERLGRSREAAALYAQVFALGFDVTDDQGVPLALYAASKPAIGAPGPVLGRIADETRRRCCLAPEALYMLRHIVDTLAPRTAGARDGEQSQSLRRLVDARIRVAEQTLALASELPALGIRLPPRANGAQSVRRWIVYGREPWLVAAVAAEDSSLALVGIDAASFLTEVNRTLPAELGVSGRIRLTRPGDTVERLEPDFAFLSMDAGSMAATPRGHGLAQPFYVGTLIVVLGVTLFGAYLIWFDVQRELHLADLRSQFVASVSHELKTPLTAIRMFAETLSVDRLQDPATRREYLETIVNETERLTRLLDNVLDFSRIERGQKEYRLEPTSLADVVERCARILAYPLAQHGFRLRVDVADDVPRVAADRDALQQAVLNLLTNAMKYSGESRDIDLRLRRLNGEAIIDVMDRGAGISADHRAHVTEKFYRVPSAENVGIPGTGLGLTLVEHIVNSHSGRLEIQSEIGQGSTFSIHLPLEVAS